MASAPAFAATPRCAVATVSTANTGRDGSGTIATVFTAGASGSRIDEVRIKATVTTTAGMVRLFIHDGTAANLLTEQPIAAVTVAASVVAEEYVLTFSNLFLPTGYSLRASTEKAESMRVIAFGGDF